jgi:hypothetical protein
MHVLCLRTKVTDPPQSQEELFEKYATFYNFKFCCIRKDGENILILFQPHHEHADIVRAHLREYSLRNRDFIGAGIVSQQKDAEFNSATCMGAFKREKPEEGADELLLEIKNALREKGLFQGE